MHSSASWTTASSSLNTVLLAKRGLSSLLVKAIHASFKLLTRFCRAVLTLRGARALSRSARHEASQKDTPFEVDERCLVQKVAGLPSVDCSVQV